MSEEDPPERSSGPAGPAWWRSLTPRTVLMGAVLAGVLILAVGRDDPSVGGGNTGPGVQYPDQGKDHLALGERYAAAGPWLDEDPLLFSAEGPPANASWLFDLALHAVERSLGFQGLRLLHVLLAGISLLLAHALFRRASASDAAACLASGLFAVLSWYRFVQLRPELVSIAASLLLVWLLLREERPPSWRRGCCLQCRRGESESSPSSRTSSAASCT